MAKKKKVNREDFIVKTGEDMSGGKRGNLQFEFEDELHCWEYMCQSEKFLSWTNLTMMMKYTGAFSEHEHTFRPGKTLKRPLKYIIPAELKRFKDKVHERSTTSIRFGMSKARGDFCLIGGCYKKQRKTFYVYYRAVELTLEFPFDLIMLENVFQEAEIDVKRIVVFAAEAFTSTREGRRKYFEKLKTLMLEEEEE